MKHVLPALSLLEVHGVVDQFSLGVQGLQVGGGQLDTRQASTGASQRLGTAEVQGMFRRSWPRCGTADGRACDQGNRGFMGQSRPLHRTVRRSLGVPCRKAGLRESL